jgi:DNA-directed RNA polymerase alpha subunit
MTNEQLLNIDELMASWDNTARHHRAMALYTAAKLERRQGNRELANRLKTAGNRLMGRNYDATHPPKVRAAVFAMREERVGKLLAKAPFDHRRLSARTIDALAACGIDAPERLLFATEAELKNLPGIGKASLGEIMRYRMRFLPEYQP